MIGDREVGIGNCVFCEKTICPDDFGSMCGECREKFEPDPHPNLMIHDDAGEEFLASEEEAFRVVMDESVNKNRSSHTMWETEYD